MSAIMGMGVLIMSREAMAGTLALRPGRHARILAA
jgi:hypothetical protein